VARTGIPTVIKLSRTICKMVGVYGVPGLSTATTPEFAAAVLALVAACNAFTALDDYPAEIDRTTPYGPEDLPPA
jgi:hypothetical protein